MLQALASLVAETPLIDSLGNVLRSLPWYAWIAIVAIIAESARKLVGMSQRHRERLEMIRHGIDPDRSRHPKP